MSELHKAARDGDIEDIRILLFKGHGIDEKDKNDNTPLHHAAENGQKEAVRYLIEQGANPNIVNKSGYLPSCFADKNSDIEMVVLLEEAMNNYDLKIDFQLLMLRCIGTDKTEFLKSLLENVGNTTYNIPYNTLLQKAIDEGDINSFNVVLSYTIGYIDNRNTTLHSCEGIGISFCVEDPK